MKSCLTMTALLFFLPLSILGQDVEHDLHHEAEQGVEPSVHQDSSHLSMVTSAVLPADGLLSVNLAVRKYSTVYQLNERLEKISQMDALLRLEAGPFPWLQLSAEVPYRSWSEGTNWIPETGSGLADGSWQGTLAGPSFFSRLHTSVFGGGNIPMGSSAEGLTEGVFSPHAGAALSWRFWTNNQVPELRLHVNLGYRWNKAEEFGYGMGQQGFQPWAPRYPSAVVAGSESANDQMMLRAAMEFRKNTTSLWVEYSQDRFQGTDAIATKEQFSGIGAGLRWGVAESWALHASYLTTIFEDDVDSDWDPAYPEWVMQVGISRQFSIGGRDRDGDGVVDRKDHCPDRAEDLDGYLDSDGCPELDNDDDGIVDELDGAPLEAEDYDGWQDEDGIPDPDNDFDGIEDQWDMCPNEPEDIDGYKDDDGCPDDFQDRDKDGISDEADDCPDSPEDIDGFEDDDGCPELDNDMDGIADIDDTCPEEPEDYDGVDDEDGCPE